MAKKKAEAMVLPALRGVLGDWAFYSCLMSMSEVAKRVSFADEIHQNKNLSDMIQRRLKGGRSKEIASYIHDQKEHFFNSLVVATYGGDPNWYAIDSISLSKNIALSPVSSDTLASVGFLSFSGEENLFAIDGQHRLSGLKQLLQGDASENLLAEDLSVIFVAHKKTKTGLERTRRLFTTLNKTAKPVSKGDIIALDEDDVMAITVRGLVEKTKLFSGDRVAFVANNNMPATNKKSLTTIGNLYDVLTILFSKVRTDLQTKKVDLMRVRPADEKLKAYLDLATLYFKEMAKNFTEVDEFFKAQDTESVVSKHRGKHGGSIMYRPIGQKAFVEIVERLTADGLSLTQAIKKASKLPTDLTAKPYCDLVWNASTETISNSHVVTLREVLLYMIGHSKFSEVTLVKRYRKDSGDETATLPNII